MDSTTFFSPIIDEIKSLRSEVANLSNRIPEVSSIKRYTPQDVADNTPISVQTVLAMIKDGRIGAERIGRKYLITSEDFERACKEVKSLKYKRQK